MSATVAVELKMSMDLYTISIDISVISDLTLRVLSQPLAQVRYALWYGTTDVP